MEPGVYEGEGGRLGTGRFLMGVGGVAWSQPGFRKKILTA